MEQSALTAVIKRPEQGFLGSEKYDRLLNPGWALKQEYCCNSIVEAH